MQLVCCYKIVGSIVMLHKCNGYLSKRLEQSVYVMMYMTAKIVRIPLRKKYSVVKVKRRPFRFGYSKLILTPSFINRLLLSVWVWGYKACFGQFLNSHNLDFSSKILLVLKFMRCAIGFSKANNESCGRTAIAVVNLKNWPV